MNKHDLYIFPIGHDKMKENDEQLVPHLFHGVKWQAVTKDEIGCLVRNNKYMVRIKIGEISEGTNIVI